MSVHWSVGPLVPNAFVKIAKSVGKSSFSDAPIASLQDAIPDLDHDLLCIPAYRPTDGHFGINVKGQHITRVLLLVHQLGFLQMQMQK